MKRSVYSAQQTEAIIQTHYLTWIFGHNHLIERKKGSQAEQ